MVDVVDVVRELAQDTKLFGVSDTRAPARPQLDTAELSPMPSESSATGERQSSMREMRMCRERGLAIVFQQSANAGLIFVSPIL